ncbi:MAG: hypothetical protein KKB51_19650 [Candidatus Riflebacteria bacterium]|nr:hypothetical protein [Candidatus Riflebacteria bacterium]
MRKFNKVFALLLFFILANLAGCQNSPGSIFSPASELFVSKVEPAFLQPVSKSSSGEDSSSSSAPTLSPLVLSFSVSNGVSCFLSSYAVRYYTTDGKSLNSGKFDHSGAISLFVKAPEVTWTSTAADSQDSSSESTASTVNQTSIDIFQGAIYSYMTKNNTAVTDDISPVIAKIEFAGRDINDKDISAAAQVNLVTTVKEEESN